MVPVLVDGVAQPTPDEEEGEGARYNQQRCSSVLSHWGILSIWFDATRPHWLVITDTKKRNLIRKDRQVFLSWAYEHQSRTQL